MYNIYSALFDSIETNDKNFGRTMDGLIIYVMEITEITTPK